MVRLDDGLLNDSKMASVSSDAIRLWLRAQLYCSANLTDGLITKAELLNALGARRVRVAELVAAGLWAELESGAVVVNGYLEHNPTRADAERQKVGARKRQEEHRVRKRNALRNAAQDASSNALTDASSNALAESCAYSLDSDSGSSPDPECISSYKPPDLKTDQVARASKKQPRKTKKQKWREAQLAFVPDESHRKLARDCGVDFGLELAKFRDHDFVHPREDASRTFNNWLRGAKPTNGKAPGLIDHEARRIEQNTRAMHRQMAQDARKQEPPPIPPAERLELAQGALAQLTGGIGRRMT